MDLPDRSPEHLRRVLDELDQLNRYTRGYRLTLRALEALTAHVPPGSLLSVLDAAAGGADFALEITRWSAERKHFDPHVTVADVNPQILQLAEQRLASSGGGLPHGPALDFTLADATDLPFADRSFDIVSCSLALHHFDPPQAVAVISEMNRVARLGIVINDLVRSWFNLAGYYLLLRRRFSGNPLLLHDGPLSIRRAYTSGELANLAARAGIDRVRFCRIPGYRLAMWAGTVPPPTTPS